MLKKSMLKVDFTVTHHLPYGLRVQLKDGRKGIIRVREISWEPGERLKWQELYPLQKHGQAVILKEANVDQVELSLRLANNDPWTAFTENFRRGMTVKGVVTGVVKYGAFVQIVEGITGLLHETHLPTYVKPNPLELFWPGDHVRVRIDEIDRNKRRVSLALATLPVSIPAWQPASAPGSPQTVQQPEQVSFHRLDHYMQTDTPRKSYLVIDDDPNQASLLSTWLEKIGQRVVTAPDGRTGMEILERERPDYALVDLMLPDTRGTMIIHEILERWPEVVCVLVTDWSHADEFTQEYEDLHARGVEQWLKPLIPDDLIDWLLKQENEDEEKAPLETLQPFQARLPTWINQQNFTEALSRILEQIQLQTGFDACYLFMLDPITRLVETVHHVGGTAPDRNALSSLGFSPVRDVSEDGDLVILERMSDHHLPRFHYLYEFLPFSACLGCQVPAAVPSRYGLFLFDSQPRPIPLELQAYVKGAALAIGALLEKRAFQEQAVLLHQTALLGHLTRGLVHEINHHLGPLLHNKDSLKRDLTGIQENLQAPIELEKKIHAANQHLAELAVSLDSIINTTHQFGNILMKPRSEVIRVDELIQRAINLVRIPSFRSKVPVQFTPPDEMILIRSQSTSLEQVLINLLLNSIQQIDECYPGRGGWVKVTVEIQKITPEYRILRILVEDNGPGIHLRQWETIFEPGVTTRSEGSGMGLYISRSLVESIGGKIFVFESFIHGGSIFTLELPWQL